MNMRTIRRRAAFAALGAGAIVLGVAGPANAATTTHRVTADKLRDGFSSNPGPDDTNWYREETRAGGGVNLTNDAPGRNVPDDGIAPALDPYEPGSLALTTSNS